VRFNALTPEFFKFNYSLAPGHHCHYESVPSPLLKAALEYVVTVVLKQCTDSLLAKTLAGGEINDVFDLLTLNLLTRDAFTYQEDDGHMKPLSIGQKIC